MKHIHECNTLELTGRESNDQYLSVKFKCDSPNAIFHHEVLLELANQKINIELQDDPDEFELFQYRDDVFTHVEIITVDEEAKK